MSKCQENKIETMRHSLAHILAAAVLELFPTAQLGVGPAVEDGFYYDFNFNLPIGHQITKDDLPKIEKKMHELIKKNLQFKKEIISFEKAKKNFRHQPYKLKLIQELQKNKESISIYKTYESKSYKLKAESYFIDLCKGPHIKSTKELDPDAFKLTEVAGAYWQGDEKNPMLVRIYGTAFHTKKELDEYLTLTQNRRFKKIRGETDANEYIILTADGKEFSPENYQYKKGEEKFRIMVEKEALKKELKDEKKESEFLKCAKQLGFEWEKMSAPGHMRFGPKAALISALVADYAEQSAKSLGLPVYSVKGTNIFNLEEKPVQEHAELFGDRLYKIEIEKKNYVMRYAACHQQFAMIKDWQISYKNLPFGAFETADSYRFEQSGELLLLFRLRQFDMPDCHIFTSDTQESKEWFFKIHQKIFAEMDKLGRNYEMLLNFTSKKFYQENKEWLLKLLQPQNKPALLSFYPSDKNYYWILNIEYNIIDALLRTREIGTAQIDVGNAQRFNIKYIDKDGSVKYPQIIHTALLGSIGRYLYAVLDTALKNAPVALPLWLCPTQIRFVPVSQKFTGLAEKFCDLFEANQLRADIDDRQKTVGHKIRDAELDLVPYILVVGEKEQKTKKLSVRIRTSEQQKIMSPEKLIKEIKKSIQNYPFRPLNNSRWLSRNPIF